MVRQEARSAAVKPEGSSDEVCREAWERIRVLAHAHLPAHLEKVQRIMGEAAVSPGVGKALAHLSVDRPVPMRELAAALRCDNSYVTAVVDSLEERGLAERQTHPTDRRIKVVHLTDAGAVLAKRIQAELAEPPSAFGALTDAEALQLRDLMRKLTD
jgi:DNA-binding MarR family transcriptional regulator